MIVTRPCDGGHDCHKAAWWKQTGFIENATGPFEQIVNNGQQTVAYVIRPFEWLAQGLVKAATLSGFFFNDCHKAVWWKQMGLLESACGLCDQIVDNRRWLIPSGLSNCCHKALWRWPLYQDSFLTIATRPCDETKWAFSRVLAGLVTR